MESSILQDENMRGSVRLFEHLSPGLLLDIGARNGESIVRFRKLWPQVKIASFEPREIALKNLVITAREAGGDCLVFPCALGEKNGFCQMFEFLEDDGGSSILEPTDTLKNTRSWAKTHRKIKIEVKRLDDFSIPFSGDMFIKVDVQGFEFQVIKGGLKTFSRATGCLIEVIREPLYKNQGNFDEINKLLKSCGLNYAGPSRRVTRSKGRIFSWADEVWLRG